MTDMQASGERQTWHVSHAGGMAWWADKGNISLGGFANQDIAAMVVNNLNALEADRDRAVKDAENWRKDVSRWKENFAEVQADREALRRELELASAPRWETCPVCRGKCYLPMGFYEGQAMATSTAPTPCRTCGTRGYISAQGLTDLARRAEEAEALLQLIWIDTNKGLGVKEETAARVDALLAALTAAASKGEGNEP